MDRLPSSPLAMPPANSARPFEDYSTPQVYELLNAAKRRQWQLGDPPSGQLPSTDQRGARDEVELLERELVARDEI